MAEVTELKHVLKDLEFQDKDIAVYLELIRLGEAAPAMIAKNIGCKRTTAYVVLGRLKDRGLVGEVKLRHSTLFRPVSLETLVSQYQHAQSAASRGAELLRTIQQTKLFEPSVMTFKGKEGILSVLEDTLGQPRSTIFIIGTLSSIYDVVGNEYDEMYIRKRVQKQIRIQTLYTKESLSQKLIGRSEKELREMKILPQGIKLKATVIVYEPDKVSYVTSRQELIATVIQSRDIYELEKTKFELLWNQS